MWTARTLSHFYLAAFGATAAVSAAAGLVASHCLWNVTPSLPRGLYWVSRGSPDAIVHSALVAFPVPAAVRALVDERHYLPPRAVLVKPVVAVEGDRVCTRGGTLTVNGAPLGAIATRDNAGRPLPHPDVCGEVPRGLLYVASPYARSFDSRTFGPIPAVDVRGTVTPVWTFSH